MQKALEQTAEKTVGLQPLVTQLSKAVQQASMEPADSEHNGTGSQKHHVTHIPMRFECYE